MGRLIVLNQVTVDDVRAEMVRRQLVDDDLVTRVQRAAPFPSSGADSDLLHCLDAGVDPHALFSDALTADDIAAWADFLEQVRGYSIVSTAEGVPRPRRDAYESALPRGDTLLTSRQRTLGLKLERRPWDKRHLPNPALGGVSSPTAVATALSPRLLESPGGPEFVAPDPLRRPLAVLAHTMALILSDAQAQRSLEGLKWRVVRPDVYEDGIEALGLLAHFQTVRTLLELDHPGYEHGLGLGILEYRGHDHHLVLNAAVRAVALKKRR